MDSLKDLWDKIRRMVRGSFGYVMSSLEYLFFCCSHVCNVVRWPRCEECLILYALASNYRVCSVPSWKTWPIFL